MTPVGLNGWHLPVNNASFFVERLLLPAETPHCINLAVPVEDIVGSMWVIFGHSAVFPKKSGQLVVGLKLVYPHASHYT